MYKSITKNRFSPFHKKPGSIIIFQAECEQNTFRMQHQKWLEKYCNIKILMNCIWSLNIYVAYVLMYLSRHYFIVWPRKINFETTQLMEFVVVIIDNDKQRRRSCLTALYMGICHNQLKQKLEIHKKNNYF